MKINNQVLMRFGGFTVAAITRSWMSTLDYQAAYYDPEVDPIHSRFEGPIIYLFWHEYIPFPFYLRGNTNIAMLLSQHQDAEWLSSAARHMGFKTVRGSTNRGGVRAIRQMLRTSQTMNLTITPDGPRGPRRELAPGAIFLASVLQIPIVATGFGYDKPWRMTRTWDQFAVPRPYTRARMIMGPAIHIPPKLGREGLERERQRIQSVMTILTDEAEDWAVTGKRLKEQTALRRQGLPIDCRFRRAA